MPHSIKKLLKYHKKLTVLVFLVSFLPAIIIIYKTLSGSFPLWYDIARDLLSALANFQKPTLIGPTSGIPGVFYGPYWIWLLSFAQIFSHDPRIITLLVATIPYLFLFPFILFRFSK